MTAMGGVRVLQFGYPKVHDGKNVFYDLNYSDVSLGIDRETDAYIGGANWGQYYIAAIGVKLAEMSNDIYLKTGIIRTLFALFGLAGLLLMGLLGARVFQSSSSKKTFLAVFLFLELLSVPLALHLREARYYSLTVFFSALVIFIFARYRILKASRYAAYLVCLPGALLLLFMTFSPAFFVFIAAIAFFEISSFVGNLAIKGREGGSSYMGLGYHIRNILPCVVSLAAAWPLLVFFDVAYISRKMAEYNTSVFQSDAMDMYLNNLAFTWKFFVSSEFMYLALFLKISLFVLFVLKPGGKVKSFFDLPEFRLSAFLSILFVVYFFAVAKIPNPLFTRYLIALQPVLTVIIILDAALILNIADRHISELQHRPGFAVYMRSGLIAAFVIAVMFNIYGNRESLKGHFSELTHENQGPLDYTIPFIRKNFENTENLVIATNYEETSFMFYLNARVIIGYVGNNLENDSLLIPDIIVYREWWGNFKSLFDGFLSTGSYEKIMFPIFDDPVNNIPELSPDAPLQHRFQNRSRVNDLVKASLYIKK